MGNMDEAADELTDLSDNMPASDDGSVSDSADDSSQRMSTTDDSGNIVQLGIDPDSLHPKDFKQ
jgi:hypothetical protein